MTVMRQLVPAQNESRVAEFAMPPAPTVAMSRVVLSEARRTW
jgi:hypothetical protein